MCNALQFKSKFSFKPCTTYLSDVAVLCRSVVSNSLWPQGLEPARLPCPWGFSRQESWSGSPCPPPPQGIVPTQGWNPGLLHSRRILYCLSYQGSPLHNCYLSTNKNMCFTVISWLSQDLKPMNHRMWQKISRLKFTLLYQLPTDLSCTNFKALLSEYIILYFRDLCWSTERKNYRVKSNMQKSSFILRLIKFLEIMYRRHYAPGASEVHSVDLGWTQLC